MARGVGCLLAVVRTSAGLAQRPLRDLGGARARASHSQRPIWPLILPGRTDICGRRLGVGMVPGTPFRTETFEQCLAARCAMG